MNYSMSFLLENMTLQFSLLLTDVFKTGSICDTWYMRDTIFGDQNTPGACNFTLT